ncbi:hypothetical protein NP233_g7796 [Leucocoprinus birnbaumii]|uniref:Uncharacterized protein n=1 Tax=Leucocoprinus birnbaumii TaxID=56174 RepID=A0AAD5VR73_9AGAR|nr:hypothetical protein NP233_g7796 [Leucocoprinus birnbaumii]
MDQIPIATPQAKAALWTALVLSIIDLGLVCGNVGTSSLFVGMAAAPMAIIHLATHLGVIGTREKRARQKASDASHNATDATRFPPPSTLGSILVTIFIIVAYLAAFSVSIWGLVSQELYNLSPIVVILDAVFDILCSAALIWLLYVGIKERREYLIISTRIRLDNISNNDNSA